MKVKDLKKILNNLPKEKDNCNVILSKDGEGNCYSPLAGIDSNSIYIPESTWEGSVYDKEWSADDACVDDKDEWEEMKKNPKFQCIVLWPTN